MKSPLFAIAAAFGLAFFGGCERESPRGGPGVVPEVEPVPDVVVDEDVDPRERTFRLKVPGTTTGIAQGRREEVKIEIERGDAFLEDVQITFEPGAGLRVLPTEFVMEPGDKETKVLIEAAADATPGQASVVVIGTPETGKPVRVRIPVDIDARS